MYLYPPQITDFKQQNYKKCEQETKRKIFLKKTVTTTSSDSSSELTISYGRDIRGTP
jgi:hypothetical protein